MLTITTAKQEDIPLLQKLIEESVRRLSIDYYSPRQIESALTYVFGIDTQLIADETYYVVRSDNEIAGCGGWSKRNTLFGGDQTKGLEDPLLDPEKDPARIRAFFVHPNWARKGVGTELLTFCEKAAASNGFTSLQLAGTLPGIPFYLRLGFKEVEHKNIVLGNGELLQLCIMKKQL